jgi:hypothetical protein
MRIPAHASKHRSAIRIFTTALHIETVNDVDLRLRVPQLHGHGDPNYKPVLSGTWMLSEGLLHSSVRNGLLPRPRSTMESRK